MAQRAVGLTAPIGGGQGRAAAARTLEEACASVVHTSRMTPLQTGFAVPFRCAGCLSLRCDALRCLNCAAQRRSWAASRGAVATAAADSMCICAARRRWAEERAARGSVCYSQRRGRVLVGVVARVPAAAGGDGDEHGWDRRGRRGYSVEGGGEIVECYVRRQGMRASMPSRSRQARTLTCSSAAPIVMVPGRPTITDSEGLCTILPNSISLLSQKPSEQCRRQ